MIFPAAETAGLASRPFKITTNVFFVVLLFASLHIGLIYDAGVVKITPTDVVISKVKLFLYPHRIEWKDEFKPTLVKRGATIGANATIVCGNTIGRYSMIGAGAVVKSDVSDYAVVAGVPAKQIGWACKCGVTLKFSDNHSVCSYCGNEYTINGDKFKIVKEV